VPPSELHLKFYRRARTRRFAGVVRDRARMRPLATIRSSIAPQGIGFAPEMTATGHAAHFVLIGFCDRKRDGIKGGILVSADIIQFIPRPDRGRAPRDFQTAFRFVIEFDDLSMGHADTAPCECVPLEDEGRVEIRTDLET
jgi:hypothetical protein